MPATRAQIEVLPPSPRWLHPLTLFLIVAIFIGDLFTPVGIAEYSLYMGPLALGLQSRNPRVPLAYAALCSGLVIAGYLFSPGTLVSFRAGVLNRAIAVIAIWAVAGAVRRGIGLSVRMAREASLRATADARVAALVDSAMDAIISVDADQRIVLFNPAAEQMFGHRASDMRGESLDRLIPGPFRDRHRRDVQNFGATGSTSRHMGALGAVRGLRADGTEFPIEASISQIRIGSEHLYTVILRDISQRLRDEAVLRDTTAELSRSNVELEQFAYVASHDLQEPLRAISGCVQLLARRNAGVLDEGSTQLIGHAVEGASRMQTLINDLLAYSRVGTRGASRRAVPGGELVGAAIANLSVAIGETRAEVSVGDLPTVLVDPTQLTQVFQNLVGNALKFRRGDPPTVAVSAARTAEGWQFSVRDNGIGISPEYFERIFSIFQRLHTRAEYPGTGIGLAICRKVVERHGGRLWVESVPGRGSTFHFILPAEERTS